MTKASPANLEMAIILPLGVVANQLMKIEADLRHLNMKALDFVTGDGGGRHAGLIEARLEHINEALDSIRRLVSDMEADIQPWSADVTPAKYSNRKPTPDRDD